MRLTSVFVVLTLLGAAAQAETDGGVDPTVYYAEDIKAAMAEHLATVTDEQQHFSIHDDVKDESLTLRFVQVHDPVRQMADGVYFACTDFHVSDSETKIYDIDFWLRAEDGKLRVFQTKIHKEPRWSLYGWYKHPRYTFIGDDIEYLYSE